MRPFLILPAFRQSRLLRPATVSALLMSVGWTLPPVPTIGEDSPPWDSLDDDGDGWSNGDESWNYFSDPYDSTSYPGAPPTTPTWDSLDDDGDGWSNGDESWIYFTDPYDAASYPDSAAIPIPRRLRTSGWRISTATVSTTRSASGSAATPAHWRPLSNPAMWLRPTSTETSFRPMRRAGPMAGMMPTATD